MEAITPVVQVVTTGTDWPAIVAAIATGVVGLAGIVATFLSGKRSINAENKRVRLNEKRRIYATCLTAVNELLMAVGNYTISVQQRDNARIGTDFHKMEEVRTTSLNVISEVQLIAPPDIGEQAWRLRTIIMESVSSAAPCRPR
jgi:hypothetical protein